MSYKVYISSTYSDLKEQRQAAAQAARDLDLKVVAMEDYKSTSEKPVEKCVGDVEACNIYLGIFAYRYGCIPKDFGKSITHLEYDAAGRAGIPRLIFLIGDEAPWPRSKYDKPTKDIDNLRQHLLENHIVTILEDVNPDKLKYEVSASLARTMEKLNKRPQLSPGATVGLPPPKFPPELPYLSNRSPQQRELKKKLDSCRHELNSRPLVCIVHGDQQECHDKFLQIVQDYWLPEILNPITRDGSIEQTGIGWQTEPLSANERFLLLWEKIASELTNDNKAGTAEIVVALNNIINPSMISFTMQVAGWQEETETALLKKWFSAWNDLENLAAHKKLLLFLCIKYRNLAGMSPKLKAHYSRLNEQAREFINTLDFTDYPNLNTLKLPELKAVEYTVLDDWVTKHAKAFCYEEELSDEIARYFTEQDTTDMPMVTLARKLRILLQETLRRNN